MGIRSLLRNAFGRSKATRDGSGAARNSADKPESATIPEAREESTPAPVTRTSSAPEAEVPAARTAPAVPSAPTTAPTPATASLPAQSSRVERAPEPSAKEETPVREEPAAAADVKAAAADVKDEPVSAPEATTPTADTAQAEETGTVADTVQGGREPEALAATTAAAADTAVDLVSRAFDNPAATAPEAAETPEPSEKPAEEAAETEAEAAQTAPSPETTQSPEPAPSPGPTQQAVAAGDSDHPVAATAPALLPLYDAARATLEKHQLTTQRATVYLVLDRSGSMRNYYKDGTVQHLAEQALALSAHFDDKATVPVVFFSTDVDGTADLDLSHYEGRIEELHSGLGHMGRTNYHWAIEAVVEHYKKSGSTHPAFVIFQTDGAPTSKPAAERALCEAAGLPVFWQFIGFGDPDARGFDFLRKLDDLTVPERRAVDNAGFFHAGRDPRSLSHDEFFQQLMVEFPEWLAEARSAKVLKDS